MKSAVRSIRRCRTFLSCPSLPLVAFCLRHFLADFIVCIASLISNRNTGRRVEFTCDQEAVAHQTGLVGRPDAQQRERKDAIVGPRIAQEPAITAVDEERARKPPCANVAQVAVSSFITLRRI